MSENYNQAALTLTQWLAEQWYNPKDPEGLQRMYDSFGEAHAMIEEFLEWAEYCGDLELGMPQEDLVAQFWAYWGSKEALTSYPRA